MPLIRKAYDNPTDLDEGLILHGFPRLVKSLVGDDFVIPKNITGKLDDLKKHTIKYLNSRLK